MTKKRILTGDRPTLDKFHLGNYIGSLENRVRLQDKYESFIMLADLHALTTHFDRAKEIKNNIKSLMLDYLSVGLDPQKVTFFVQSQVPEIPQIAYLLSTITPRPVIARQPVLKEKLDQGEQDTVALFYYPVLMAADILAIRGDLVPVGKDQKAHVEFARDIAQKFNEMFGEAFVVPEVLIGDVPTLPGTDGKAKMSKSLGNAIYLSDSPKTVREKVMGMYTDPKRIHSTDPGTVEGNPVFVYLDAFSKDLPAGKAGQESERVEEYKRKYREGRIGDIEVKEYLAGVLNGFLDPIRKRRKEFEKKPRLLEEILEKGSKRAREEAKKTLERVKRAMGLI
ncbi:MAG: tryptophan--tRNA ligase [Candidatus Blackburnbacteria bacterium]|nr:tryptophan--tRNA ligase [Candidatus Blackburnbacteria bacterium]